MPQYRAKQDVPGTDVKKGDIVDFKEELVDGYKNHFEPVKDEPEEVEGEDDLTGNLDRAALKARAEELGIKFAGNTPTAKLVELIKEAEEKAED